MRRWFFGLALVLFGLPACAMPPTQSGIVVARPPSDPPAYRGAVFARPHPMPDVTLKGPTGHRFNLRSSPSRPVTLLYFGYTRCPDTCRQVMSGLTLALQALPPGTRADVQVLFVTIDPKDSAQDVAHWLDRVAPEAVGLRGSPEAVHTAAHALGVGIEDESEDGWITHGAQVIAFDREHEGVLVWTPDVPVTDIAHDLELLVAHQR